MVCPNCQTVNPDGARFCMACGQALQLPCPNCGTELPASAAFCFNCGHRIAQPQVAAQLEPQAEPPAGQLQLQSYIPKELLAKLEAARQGGAMEGERRVVTMLFCDIKGSTAAAGKLDPEEWAEIINAAFPHLITPVYQYEGTVARLMGDALLAFFGAPIAHEDDPQRAVLAGLKILESIQPFREQIQQQWHLDFNVRVGINTGLVVVGAVGSDLRMEYTAMGDAINVAARMEQTAEPGSLQIAEATYRLIAPLIEVEDLGAIPIKGKDEPVRAYRVLRYKSAPGRLRGLEGLESPLVGRDAEMHKLRGAIIELRQGRGQIVSLMGEAGLGKSRLIAELRQMPTPSSKADARLLWLEGRSLSYQTSTPYAPFADLFRSYFELDGELSDQDNFNRISARIEAVLPGQAAEMAPSLASLLGIDLSGEAIHRIKYLEPPQLRARVFQATSDLVEGLAARRPLVMVFDDLHWCDPTSLDLLEQLMPLTDRGMLMLVSVFRPARQEPSWRFHETAARDFTHRYTPIQLQPLDEDSSRELVANLLHIDDLPQKVRGLILAKAEGNPFYVEEVIRSLIDTRLIVQQNGHWHATREIDNIIVPDTLAAVITTRLDQLNEDAKRLVQTASVIGRQFQYETLTAIYPLQQGLEQSLSELQRRELIREKSRVPHRLYQFKHALTQETAYHSLLLKTRRQLHLLVGEFLERHDSTSAIDIARHFMEARQPQRALPYLVDAGDRASRAYSTIEAIGYYQQALEILGAQPDLALARRAYEGLGSAQAFANQIPQAVDTYQTMLSLAEVNGDVPMQVSALNKLSYISALRLGQFHEAEGYINEADRRARENDDKAGLSELGLIRCMMCTAVADFDGVVRYMDETMDLGRQLGVKEQMTLGMAHIASSQIYMLQFDEAWETIQQGLKLSREIDDRQHEAIILVDAAPFYHWRNGDLESARHSAEQGLEIAAQIGSLEATPAGLRAVGILAHQQGDYEQALSNYERYLKTSQSAGFIWYEAEAMCLLGSVYLDISPALADRMTANHQQAMKLLEYPGGAMLGGTAWTELGFCAQAIGKLELAGEFFKKGLKIPTITSKFERPRILLGAALVALSKGDLESARDLVEEARLFAEEYGLKHHFPLIALTAGRVRARRGDAELALQEYESAVMSAQGMTIRPLIWHARADAAEILSALGRAAEAQAMRQEAERTIAEIAALFKDAQLRDLFQENASKTLR